MCHGSYTLYLSQAIDVTVFNPQTIPARCGHSHLCSDTSGGTDHSKQSLNVFKTSPFFFSPTLFLHFRKVIQIKIFDFLSVCLF